MIAQSNLQLPTEFQRWKEGQFVYFFNHKDNGIQKEGEEGRRYAAEFIITKSVEKVEIEKALTRTILDPALNQMVIDNIEVEAKPAIDLVKDYKPDATTLTTIAAILIKTPIEIKPVEIKSK